jgi:hypothetical protein
MSASQSTIIDMQVCDIRGDYYPTWNLTKVWVGGDFSYVVVHKDYVEDLRKACDLRRAREFLVRKRVQDRRV